MCVDNGAVEITLLGQNVNDYGKTSAGGILFPWLSELPLSTA